MHCCLHSFSGMYTRNNATTGNEQPIRRAGTTRRIKLMTDDDNDQSATDNTHVLRTTRCLQHIARKFFRKNMHFLKIDFWHKTNTVAMCS